MVENAVPVFRSEIGAMKCDAQLIRYRLCVGQILLGSAVFGTVILFPIFHEKAFHPVACFDQYECCDGGIDTA